MVIVASRISLTLVDVEDIKTGRNRKRKGNSSKVLTKKSKKEKEDLIEKLGLKGKKTIEVKKSIRIPVHYDVTKNKMDILNNLTARITYGIRLISEVVYDLVKDVEGTDEDLQFLKLKAIEDTVYDTTDIVEKTGLSSGFIQQCINKVIDTYESYKELHKKWEGRVKRAEERFDGAINNSTMLSDDKELEKADKWLEKLMKREPSKSDFRDKTPCRLDNRTGNIVKWDGGKLSKLWIKISTLEKGKTICIPLNPSQYHINELKDVVVDDFEIIKGGNSGKKKNKNKYYIHVSITKVIEEKSINSIGGIDQGLNKSIAAVLLGLDSKDLTFLREEQLLDSAKVELLEKYDDIVSSLQEVGKWDKLRQMRGKRENVSIYHDWCLARKVAEFTEGSYLAIGNSNFRQGMFRGNRMLTLRKRIGKWSYSQQRKFIKLKRSEMGYRTELRDEYGTSRECCGCHSKLTRRIFEEGFSYILCHSCGMKKDADLNAANVIATRCRDDRLKAGMIRMENPVSRQDGSPRPLIGERSEPISDADEVGTFSKLARLASSQLNSDRL